MCSWTKLAVKLQQENRRLRLSATKATYFLQNRASECLCDGCFQTVLSSLLPASVMRAAGNVCVCLGSPAFSSITAQLPTRKALGHSGAEDDRQGDTWFHIRGAALLSQTINHFINGSAAAKLS